MYFNKGGTILREINLKLHYIETRKNVVNDIFFDKYFCLPLDFGCEIANDFEINKLYKEIDDLLKLW